MRGLSLRTLEATVTPGVFATARPGAPGKTPASALPLGDTMWPARIWVPRESANELRRAAPSVATDVTSARPIINAAAVEAVRAGLRTAFCAPRRPAEPPRLRAGRPTSAASGRTRWLEI